MKVVHGFDALLDEEATATQIGVSRRTLQDWRVRGKGPAYISISRRCVRYRTEDIRSWLESRIRRSTSQKEEGGCR